jgi:hypothetical protein
MCRFASNLHEKLPGVELDSQSGMFIEEAKKSQGRPGRHGRHSVFLGRRRQETFERVGGAGEILSSSPGGDKELGPHGGPS